MNARLREQRKLTSEPPRMLWLCRWCGGAAEDEPALRAHQEWCLGDPLANTQLLDGVAARYGELAHEDIVAAARRQRARLRAAENRVD